MSVFEGSEFSFPGGWIGNVGADLDEYGRSGERGGKEIYLIAIGSANAGSVGFPPLKFEAHGGFQGMAEVGFSAAVEGVDESGIYGIRITRVGLALAFAGGVEGKESHEKGIFQVTEHGMEAIFGDGDAA